MKRQRLWMSLLAGLLLMCLLPASAAAQRWDDDDDRDRDRDRPRIYDAPDVRGNPMVGGVLEAYGGRYDGDWPMYEGYVWLRCDSPTSLWSCEILWSATGSLYTLTPADTGKYMRVWFGVSNREGRDDEVSSAYGPIAAPPAPPPPPPPPPPPVATPPAGGVNGTGARSMRPFPVVRIRGWLTTRGAMVTLLTVKAPKGAQISIRCLGRRCPRPRWARATSITRVKAFEGRLRAGTKLVVRVTRKGFVGKHTVIKIRQGKQPVRHDRCVYPGSRKPQACPQ